MSPPVRPLADRLWEKVDRTGDCWLWTGLTNAGGYGRLKQGRTHELFAHRVAWELAFGPIPTGLFVLHRCDVPNCVRPSHLFLGTKTENMADRDQKQRQARGERQGLARLTADDVRVIRASRDGQRALARRFGVDKSTIADVQHGLTW